MCRSVHLKMLYELELLMDVLVVTLCKVIKDVTVFNGLLLQKYEAGTLWKL